MTTRFSWIVRGLVAFAWIVVGFAFAWIAVGELEPEARRFQTPRLDARQAAEAVERCRREGGT